MGKPTTIQDALAYWESGDGRPYMGNLIDRKSYEKNPDSLGCMCAQGQVLVLSGKRTVEELLDGMEQTLADKEVAEIWNISTAHSILLRKINDSVSGAPFIVIADPGKVLGDKWSKVLDFWWMMDCLTNAQWNAASAAARGAARGAAWACNEIQGFDLLDKTPFLNAFGIKSLDDIPSRPDDYGLGFVPEATQ